MTGTIKKRLKRQLSVLIVEDQKYNLLVLNKMLERMGISVITAENGLEALEICSSHDDIDLVLMDIKMPVMDGFTAMKEIKKLRPGLKIIAETAYALSGDEKRIIESGFDDYLPKPITRESLEECIKRNTRYS